jgi:transcriptional regulator with GAF, ATPase, and Fis domain
MEAQDQNDSVAFLRATVKQQKEEIEQLQMQLKQERFAEELHRLLASSTVTSLVLSPFSRSHLLETVVQTATHFLNARSSALFLIDETTQELVFEVAVGPAAAEVKKLRVPLGHGIAGLVALTGQLMAVADVQEDPRLATDIAFAVNYIPENILCVPLFYDDRVIGALEMLDKQTGLSFNTDDMDMATRFANIAAVAIAQSCAFVDQQAFFQAMLRSFSEKNAEHREHLYRQATAFMDWSSTTDMLNAKARELALSVHELILDGEQSCDLCIRMLQSIVASTRERKQLQASLSGFGQYSLPSGW